MGRCLRPLRSYWAHGAFSRAGVGDLDGSLKFVSRGLLARFADEGITKRICRDINMPSAMDPAIGCQ